jgi:hypothetical protein
MVLANIFRSLEEWVDLENAAARAGGLPPLKRSRFRIVGQTALLHASLGFDVTATMDVDAYTDASYAIKSRFNELLRAEGLELDPLSDEIWMPTETRYVEIFAGDWIHAERAEPEYVLVSKAVKALEKNKQLLRSYLAAAPADKFFVLCQKYGVNLGAVVGVK